MGVETVCYAITLPLFKTGSLLCRLLWSSKKENENQEGREGIKGLWEFCELGKLWQKSNESNAQGYSCKISSLVSEMCISYPANCMSTKE